MIRCTIVENTTQAGESASRIARATVAETLTMGRAAACKIYLPDPRVRLEHATIHRAEDGYLYIEGNGGSVLINEEPQDLIRLCTGQTILIGPFEFVVADVLHGPDCQQLQLTLNFTHKPVEAIRVDTTRSTGGLRRSPLNVRAMSWLAALACLVLLLALPLWQVYQPRPALAEPMETKLDVMWNPGEISSAHKNIANQCQSCHTKPFQRVKDAACAACHKDSGPHIGSYIALQAQVFGGQRCASCHREHQGEDGMKRVDARGCEDCHGNIKTHAPATILPNVGDFGKDHPEFRLTMRVGVEPKAILRVDQDANLQERSGLKFPHALHLAASGIKSPTGPLQTKGRVVLECRNCHQLDSAKVRYQPIRMETACAGCHRLGVDAQSPTRQVPHAEPAVVINALRDIFSSLALEPAPSQVVTINSLLQGPQLQAGTQSRSSVAQWVNDKTLAAAKDMFENPKGTCQTCHTITRTADSKTDVAMPVWKVQAVLSNDHWLPKSKFTHAQHDNAPCSTCHAAAISKTSADILIPPIATCRKCHTGTSMETMNLVRQDKVVSRCSSCHDFHSATVHGSFAAERARAAASSKGGTAP